MKYKMIILPCFAALILGGCSTIDEIKKPKQYNPSAKQSVPIPAQLPSGGAYAPLPQIAQSGLKWNELITDSKLSEIISKAQSNNRDLRASIANVEMARNLYLAQKSNQIPTINGGVSAANISGSENKDGTNYTANLGFSAYEIDLFGRVKSLTNAQYENYVASRYDWQSFRISLIAEIANAYITLAGDIDTYNLAKKTETANIRTLELTQAKFKAGLISRVDVRQAETNLASTRSDIAASLTAIEQDKNALTLLIGAPYQEGWNPVSLDELGKNIGKVPVGLSSEILLARPDVISAEHDLLASEANIDAARAAMFPKITLNSALGLASDALDALLKSNAFAFSNTLALTQNIYGGANKYNLAYSEAQREKLLATYEKTIQTAFREVADALARFATIDDQLKAQNELVTSAAESLRLNNIRYKSGLTSFLSVLDAERTNYNAEKTRITTKKARLSNQIALYRSIGADGLNEKN